MIAQPAEVTTNNRTNIPQKEEANIYKTKIFTIHTIQQEKKRYSCMKTYNNCFQQREQKKVL